MNKDKLGKDELLDVLSRMRRIADKYTKIGMYGLGVSDSDNARDEERLEKFKQADQQIKQMIENWPEVDFSSWFYKNCKRQRKVGAKICQVCPFRRIIESQEVF